MVYNRFDLAELNAAVMTVQKTQVAHPGSCYQPNNNSYHLPKGRTYQPDLRAFPCSILLIDTDRGIPKSVPINRMDEAIITQALLLIVRCDAVLKSN